MSSCLTLVGVFTDLVKLVFMRTLTAILGFSVALTQI